MLFNSFIFIIFFISVVTLYYISPHKFRWILLLISSCIFYMMWNPLLILLLLFSVLINFLISLKIHQSSIKAKQKHLLILSVVINFGILFIFKYLIFLTQSAWFLLDQFGLSFAPPDFHIILPMGISFYTFQAAGYTIDVYRKTYKPEQNFFKFTLFITFFPQLVAGPIERADNLMPQLFTKKQFHLDNLVIGAKFMAFGFFKKIVIADRISVSVNTVYNSPSNFEGLSFVIASFLFAFQIYCDFCGYSDIAVGCAKVLGIDLMQNFRQPYFSRGIKEFWRRWHISLSTWFKDYLYFPLGGNRVSKPRHYFNTLVTFLVSGLWHGADWTFVLWGGLHGSYQVLGDMIFGAKKGAAPHLHNKDFVLVRCIKVIITFTLVCFAWIFFRANTIGDAFYIVGNLFNGYQSWTSIQYVYDTLNNLGVSLIELVVSLSAILFLLIIEFCSGKDTIHDVLMKRPAAIRWSFYLFITAFILSLGVFYHAGEFIYFQF